MSGQPGLSLPSPQVIAVTTVAASLGIMAVSAIIKKIFNPEVCPVIPGRLRRLRDALYEKAGGLGRPSYTIMPVVAAPELREVGADRQAMNRRLYMQLRVLDADLSKTTMDGFVTELKKCIGEIPCVLYRDTVTNNGIGLLTWSDDAGFFCDTLNGILDSANIANLFTERHGWTMFGKTYCNGHEKDLDEFLFKKPIRNSLKNEWAIWYPLRRKGPFYVQPASDQCQMLLVHAAIGKAFADVHAASDVRLKCFGIDPNDNEYMVGILGADLHPLSRVVEEMRKTQHTAQYIEKLGPFFVGKQIYTVSG